MKHIIIIAITLLSFDLVGQLIDDEQFLIRQKSYIVGQNGIETKNRVKWEQSKVNFDIDTMSRCTYFEMDTPSKKFTFYNSFDTLGRSTTLIIAQLKDSLTISQTYIEYINGVKFIEGLSVNGQRIGKWKMYDINSEEIIGIVTFISEKKIDEKENCIERFLCSYILEEWGDVGELLKGFGR